MESSTNGAAAVMAKGGSRMLCLREHVLVLASIGFSTESPTGLRGCEREEVSLRVKVEHGKSNLCVLMEGRWKWQA